MIICCSTAARGFKLLLVMYTWASYQLFHCHTPLYMAMTDTMGMDRGSMIR